MAAPLKVRGFASKISPAKVSSTWFRSSSQLSQDKPPQNSNEGKLPQNSNEKNSMMVFNRLPLPRWMGTRWEKTKVWWTEDAPEREERIKDEDFPNFVGHNSERDFYEMIKLQEGHTAPIVKGPLDGKYKVEGNNHYPLEARKLQGWDFEMDDVDLLMMRMRHSNSKFMNDTHEKQLKANTHMNNEIAAANFFCYNSGKVKFLDRPFWIQKDKKGMYSLPPATTKGLTIEAIDGRSMCLTPVVFDYLDDLESLRYLNISGNEYVDDACLAKLQRICPNLEYLDVSNCKYITHNGITALHNLKCLQLLKMDGLPRVQHRGFVAMLMEEHIPGLQVLGITEEDTLPPETLTPIGETRRVAALLGLFDYEKYAQPSEAEVIPDDKNEWEIPELTFTPEHKGSRWWYGKKYTRRLIRVDWIDQKWCGNPGNVQTGNLTIYL